MRRCMLTAVAGVFTMLALPDGPAAGENIPGTIFLADRQNSEIRVVMYMTPW